MINDKRNTSRFTLKFNIFSNEIHGEGINISNGGFGFFTDEEIVPAEDIPFNSEVTYDNKGEKKIFTISGRGRLLFSTQSHRDNNVCYYNGFEFIQLTKESEKSISDLLKSIKENED